MGTRGVVSLVVASAVALAGAAVPWAGAATGPRPGTLDPSFGRGGKVFATSPPTSARSEFGAVARRPDGSLLLELQREARDNDVREIELRRPDGSLDRSFGKDGRIRVSLGHGLAPRADGSVLVGTNSCGPERGSVLLLDPGGHRDPGFGNDGCAVRLDFTVERVSVAADGGILLAGSRVVCPCSKVSPPDSEPVVARLLSDGRPDPGFGTHGVVHLHADLEAVGETFGNFEAPYATDLPRPANGGVVVASGSRLLGLGTDGNLSPSFGDGGRARLRGAAAGMLSLADGRIVVVATVSGLPFEQAGRIEVSRFLPDGTPDPSFGGGGRTQVMLPAEAMAQAVAQAPGEGVLVSGELRPDKGCPSGCTPTPFLVRLRENGEPDLAFGSGGLAVLPLPPVEGYGRSPGPATALVSSPDGSAVVAGGDRGEDALAIATAPDGSPDVAFGAGGTLLERHYLPPALEPSGLALDPRGGFTVAAEGTAGSHEFGGFLLRFRRDGRQWPGPAGTGVAPTLARGEIRPLRGNRVVSLWEGQNAIRAVGRDGAPVPGFGDEGVARLPADFEAQAIEHDRGGGVLVVGTIGARQAMGVFRLGPGGGPRPGFGRRGLAEVRFGRDHAVALAATVQVDGGVVLTGWVGGHTGAARLLPGGRLDRGFGRDGRVGGLLARGTFGTQIASFDGGVVIGATSEDSPPALAGVVRLDRRGRQVRGFGRRGAVHPSADGRLLGLFARDGRFVVVTDTEYARHSSGGVELRRYLGDGSPDRRYGSRGLARGGVGQPRYFHPVAAVQQPDGRIVVAGAAWDGEYSRVELLRFRR